MTPLSPLDLRKKLVSEIKSQKDMPGNAQVVVAMDYSGSMIQLYKN